jgi:hypothetical protein
VAERLGHSEVNFAELMTQEARTLGMTSTTYDGTIDFVDRDGSYTAQLSIAVQRRGMQAAIPFGLHETTDSCVTGQTIEYDVGSQAGLVGSIFTWSVAAE